MSADFIVDSRGNVQDVRGDPKWRRSPGRGYLGIEEVGARPPTIAHNMSPRSRRRRRAGAISVVLLLVLAAIVVMARRRDDHVGNADVSSSSPPVPTSSLPTFSGSTGRSPDYSNIKFTGTAPDPSAEGNSTDRKYSFVVPESQSGGFTVYNISNGLDVITITDERDAPEGATIIRGDVRLYVGHLAGTDSVIAQAAISEAATKFHWQFYSSPCPPPSHVQAEVSSVDNEATPIRGPPVCVLGHVTEVVGPDTIEFSLFDITVRDERIARRNTDRIERDLDIKTWDALREDGAAFQLSRFNNAELRRLVEMSERLQGLSRTMEGMERIRAEMPRFEMPRVEMPRMIP